MAVLGIAGLAMLATPNRDGVETIPYRVAVLPFDNRTGDPALDDLGHVAADWITDGLTAIDSVQIIPTTTVLEILADAGEADPLPWVARRTRAGLVVTGSFALAGDSVEIRAQLADSRQGRVLTSFEPARSPRSEPTVALGPLRDRVLGGVAVEAHETFYGDFTTGSRPPNYEAYRSYRAGIELFYDLRYGEAIRAFDRALEADSSFAAVRIWTATAFSNTGQYARMDSVLRLVEADRSELSEIVRLMLDWGQAILQGDHMTEYRVAREIYHRSPNETSLYVAALAAYRVNRLREATDLLAGLDADHRTIEWIPYYTTWTYALHALGEHDRELAVARAARAQFMAQPFAVYLEARALAALGRVEEAEAVLDQSMVLAPAGGYSPGYVHLLTGLELRRHGSPEAGERVLRRGLDWYQARDGEVDYRYSVARAHLWLGEHDRAGEILRDLAAESPAVPRYHGQLGIALAASGHGAEARGADSRLADLSNPYARGWDMFWRAAIAAHLGEPERALDLLRDALAEGVSLGGLHEEEALRPLWDDPTFRALLEPVG